MNADNFFEHMIVLGLWIISLLLLALTVLNRHEPAIALFFAFAGGLALWLSIKLALSLK